MTRVKRLKDESLYVDMANIIRIGNEEIKKAKEENKAFGIPETFWKNGKVYYVVDDEVTSVRPDVMK